MNKPLRLAPMPTTFENAGHDNSRSLIGIQQAMDPQQGWLDQVHKRWQDYPGSAPGGTGPTGLMSNDAAAWSRMQNENTQALNAERSMVGKDPLQVRLGRNVDEPIHLPHSTVWDPVRQTAMGQQAPMGMPKDPNFDPNAPVQRASNPALKALSKLMGGQS